MIELRRCWLLIAAPLAVVFAFATPPFQTPDEVGHWWYANAIARGKIAPDFTNSKPSALVPRGARDIVLVLWVTTAGHAEAKIGTARIANAARVSFGPDEVPVTFPAQYTAVPYAATAFACLAGDLFRIRPFFTFYFGRLLNAAAMILLAHAAVRRMKSDGAPFAAIALLPMALYLAASYSPDAITIGVAFYVTALTLTPEESRSYWLQLIGASALLALCKPVYFLVPLVVFVTLRSSRKHVWPAVALVVAIAAAVAVSAWTVRRNYYAMRQDVITSPTAQIAAVGQDPIRFAAIAAHDYRDRGAEYLEQFVGRLGWLDVRLPRPLVNVTELLLLCVAIITPTTVTIRTRIAALVIVIASLALISLSQYVAWTGVGAREIAGIQGRYFLPLAPLALTIVGTPRPWLRAQQWIELAFAAAAIVLNVVAVGTIVQRYY